MQIASNTDFLNVCLISSRINLDTAKEHLERFALLDSDKDGKISLQDFALHYKLPNATPVKEIFSIFDRVRFLMLCRCCHMTKL